MGAQLLVSVAVPKHAIAQDYLQPAYNPQEVALAQEALWSKQLTVYSQTLVGKRTGQCVMALRNYFGIPYSEVHGYARYTKINSHEAKVGSVIVLNMSRYGHVGIVIAVSGDKVTYFDSNGNWRQRGAIRTINKNNRLILGYHKI